MNVFVFGSNLAGRHGAGAARDARLKHGALYGVGSGLTGHAYAIPTKDGQLRTLPLGFIHPYVQEFVGYAQQRSELIFEVTRIGCGLAGYRDEDIAPLFLGLPRNCHVPGHWSPWFPIHPVWTHL